MKKSTLVFLFLLTATLCVGQSARPGKPVEAPADILKNMDSFSYYVGDYVNFYEDYITYDDASNIISKERSYQLMLTEKYIPLRLISTDGNIYYQLYKLTPAQQKNYNVAGWVAEAYDSFKREGKKLPDYNFTDLKGNVYNPATTKGKIMVLKTWFVACSTCETQRPAFNHLVKRYKNRKDILFVSLVNDSAAKVIPFLKMKKMDYMVVPGEEEYNSKKLKISGYPTYYIINRDGVIARVVNNPENVDYVLKKLN
ncbi:TlpA family protein disulfide reductase [Mucilaginibacter ginsenosidivorans]|uniref:TlpA family protein disulfide reductase n=1 Tax=Mucilaginibacter ginsenosidivorans TaxID=398053 RepID=A0A5B8UVM9_9SPHI|nr:TlpA disulfide reductase family protein [Mucilaginibacter ginsenosidivorans]QEC63177.1 TlpA family protein disulfide reductase [Mucilaginibacter ginsenosidivorans]